MSHYARVPLSGGHTSPTPSQGAEVPQELFANILWHALHDSHIHAVPQANSESLRDLMSISLVSTYFARLCRPWIYHHVALRSHFHFKGLMALLDNQCGSASTPLLTYTKHITIISTEEEHGFWIHHFPMTLIPKMQSLGIPDIPLVRLGVEAQLPGLGPDQNQAHWQLPRTLPPSLFRCVYALDLTKMHFERGEDLLRCLSMLPSVSRVNLVDLTCTVAPDATVRVHRPLSSRLRMISGSPSAPPDAVFATILPAIFATCCGNFAPLLSHPSEPAAILDLLQLAGREARSDENWDWWTISRGSRSFTLRIFNRPRMEITLYPMAEENASAHDDLSYDCIVYMAEAHAPYPKSQAFWLDMAAHIARLRFLRDLDLEFNTVDAMDDFVWAMRPALESVHAIGRRVYLSERENGTWYTAADALKSGVVPPHLQRPPKDKILRRAAMVLQDGEGSAAEP